MNKNFSRKLRKCCACAAALLALTGSALAAHAAPVDVREPVVVTTAEATPRIQEVKWVYRTYNGVLQKRLWSHTEGKWLTDWIDC